MAKKIAEWQQRFGLTDWLIVHQWKQYHEDMKDGTNIGTCTPHYPSAQAELTFIEPDERMWSNHMVYYAKTWYQLYEVSIVHELIHLVTIWWNTDDSDEGEREQMERAVETIARVIVFGRVGN